MLADFGYVLLLISFLLSIYNSHYFFKKKISAREVRFFLFFNQVIAAFTLTSFLILITLYITSDFSIANVYLNSHSAKPLIYKISASWGNHEGSMLLFITMLSLQTLVLQIFFKTPETNKINTYQNFIYALLAAFVLFASNPFEQLAMPMREGQGFNPILQDIGLALHPPLLYLGYTGFSVLLSSAVCALSQKNYSRNLIRISRFWAIFSFAVLTFGIALGSWWAYRELGWGGYWFWDPVENSSLMPWLSSIALIHCLILLQKRDEMPGFTNLLSILTFSLCLIGFFLVRSGVLNSVHSFANDPTRGLYMLIIIALLSGLPLIFFSLRAGNFNSTSTYSFFSRDSALVLNNIIFLSLTFVIFIANTYPIMLEVFAEKTVSVGAPYYHKLFIPISFAGLALMCASIFLSWKKESFKRLNLKSFLPVVLSILIAALLAFTTKSNSVLCITGYFISALVITCNFKLFLSKLEGKRISSLQKSFLGMITSHIGIGLLVLAISLNSALETSSEKLLKPGQKTEISGYQLSFIDLSYTKEKNYFTQKALFNLIKNDKVIGILTPERRFYPVENQYTTETAIHYSPFSNIYLAIGLSNNKAAKNEIALRAYYKPFINLIWLSSLIIAAGGLICLREKLKKA